MIAEAIYKDGTLQLTSKIDLKEGEVIKLIVLKRSPEISQIDQENPDDPFSLEGSVLRYDDPTEPAISPDEWEVHQ